MLCDARDKRWRPPTWDISNDATLLGAKTGSRQANTSSMGFVVETLKETPTHGNCSSSTKRGKEAREFLPAPSIFLWDFEFFAKRNPRQHTPISRDYALFLRVARAIDSLIRLKTYPPSYGRNPDGRLSWCVGVCCDDSITNNGEHHTACTSHAAGSSSSGSLMPTGAEGHKPSQSC